jgi:hypothetical protein
LDECAGLVIPEFKEFFGVGGSQEFDFVIYVDATAVPLEH